VFASHLLDVLSNLAVRFQVLDERPDALEYGFRVPVEASHVVMGAGREWLPTGYNGSLWIGRDSLDVRRLTVDTEELPPQTLMCKSNMVLEFPSRQTAGPLWFVPTQTRTHDILRDATEIDSVSTISGCREVPPAPASRPLRQGAPLPGGLHVTLNFDADIDWDEAAAGDSISATVTLPILTSNPSGARRR
jgi:hypothetical protein